MDHAEATESEGQVRQNVVGDDPRLRGNGTNSTLEFIPDGEDEASNENGLAFGQDGGHVSMEVARIKESDGHGSMEVPGAIIESFGIAASSDGGTSGAIGEGVGSLYHPNGAEESRREEHPSSRDTNAAINGMDPEKTPNSAPQANGKPAVSCEAIRADEVSGTNYLTPQLLLDDLGMYSAEQSPFEHVHEMLVDDEDDDGILSDKASSADILSDSDVFQSGQRSADRAPLENAYGPFIHPTDTCLADARERLHVALEQTRLLGASFTEQAYERYRCLLKPVHESLEAIIEPILIDPHQALVSLREDTVSIKGEKDKEKKQALQAGVGLEELAYFGEGLHLVVLPDDEVDETEINVTQYRDRGPTNPETGEHVEEISAAAASATEQVFDRIRRIRAIRMGVDVRELGIQQVDTTQLTRNLAQDHRTSDNFFSPSFASAAFASPSLSVNSGTGDAYQISSKGSLQHLLTLAPDAEGARPDGNLTAVQSALIARGVGMHEMKRDPRINPLRQRMVQPDYFSPTPSYKFLPPLLGPHQIYRLQAAGVRRVRPRIRSGTGESIKSVIKGICSSLGGRRAETPSKHLRDYGWRMGDSTVRGKCGSSGGIKRGLYDERTALEFDLLWRIHGEMLESQRIEGALPASNTVESHAVTEITDPGCESLRSTSNDDDFDPLLAFSVMNAVGLVRRKDDNSKHQQRASGRNNEHAYAQTLGLDNLASLTSVKAFFRNISSSSDGKNRHLSDNGDMVDEANTMISDTSDKHNANNIDGIHVIRGGGGQDEATSIESITISEESGKMKESGVSKTTTSKTDVPVSDPSLAGYAGFGSMYNAVSQVPLGEKQSQNIISSQQLWQHQLGVPPDLYHTASLSHQLTDPHTQSDLSDFYLRNSLVGNSDWAALQTNNAATRAEYLAQHPQLATSLGIFPGQMNLTFLEQEFAKTMLLHDHQNAAAARAHGAATAAASARYQATLSSFNHQNPFGFQDRSNEIQFISSLPKSYATMEQKGKDSKQLHRKRSRSLSEQVVVSNKVMKRTETSIIVADAKRPASAPPSPLNFGDSKSAALTPPSPRKFEPNNHLPKGSSKMIDSHDVASIPELNFALPAPPVGMDKDIADLIAHGKFHDAHSRSQSESHESVLLVDFLLSLGAAIPIPKDLIAVPLVKKLGSSNFQLRLHGFAGSSSSATASREVIAAIISIWLWTEYKNYFNQTIVASENSDADLCYKWLINLAVDMSLTALANFIDSHSTGKSNGQITILPNEQVAAIASKSLANQVYLDYCADASFPILDDLVKLLDTLRTDALRTKTQERVLLAALVSRCGNMTEAFSNAYVSSIVRAGLALGHENVCEMVQDEVCRASTLLPYDYFHDNFGVWEEPCRPITGYHAAIGGDELKRQAHARSLIQKSMMRLQNRLGLKGGISDGGPYFPIVSPVKISAPLSQAAIPPLVKTPSGSLKRRGSYDNLGTPGPGEQDLTFNPDHRVDPMLWDPNDVGNLPYGEHEFGGKPIGIFAVGKKMSLPGDEDPEYHTASLAGSYPSTQELEWEDVANMFFHGGSTRSIDINYDFDSHDQLGKKKIFAPFVRAFDFSTINQEGETGVDISSDEEVCDEAILQRHQKGLDEMKLKIDAALESRKQLSQQRGRKR
ncbi:hypothetical protein ACHAXA_005867 [Cyclostephanos tholiformis]|uniref:Uncharacterized protein n=1 Tax=Cyclostephanos tholiformis TaxID=382380 RepID=A0ABD3R664_9STRA